MRPLLTAVWVALACFAGPAHGVENMTNGFRFDPPLLCLAEAPSDPNIIYVGSAKGFVYVTRDGGRSWDELRLLTPRDGFFGSIRADSGATLSMGGSGATNLAPSFDFSGLNFEDEIDGLILGSPLVPLPTAPSGIASGTIAGALFAAYSDGTGSDAALGQGAGGGADASLGVGLSANAPRLAGAVRRKRGWGVGINLKQTLSLKSAPATGVRFLDVHPRDPNDIVAATADGLYRSRDGGRSWPLVLTGATPRERGINHLRRSATDPDVLFAGTGSGLHVSRDGGDSFEKLINPLVSNSDVQWVDLHPTDPQTWFVGLSWGLLRTRNGGVDFDVQHRSPWPALSFVRRVAVDPRAPNTVLIATSDGPLRSTDGGDTFERVGGPGFIGFDVQALVVGDRPGRFMVGGERDLWLSDDAGDTWRIAYYGAQWDLRAAVASLTPGVTWLVTSAEVLRLGGADHVAPVPDWLVDRFRRIVAQEPTVQQAVQAALARAGVDVSAAGEALSASTWAALLPVVDVYWRTRAIDVDVDRTLDALGQTTLFTSGPYTDDYLTVFARWDLLSLVHRSDETPARRIPGQVRKAEWQVRATTVALYQERRRLQIAALSADDDAGARLRRNLRFEELTAHLNALTGDLFAPYSAL